MSKAMRPEVTAWRGFTLIELLIVVAIIAILASIAVPNFLEAQIRAKSARAQADMKTMEFGIEAYCVDNNIYPPARDMSSSDATQHKNYDRFLSMRLLTITTPISYLGSLPKEIFPPASGWNGKNPTSELQRSSFDTYDYFDAASDEDEDMHYLSEGDASAATKATDSTRGCAWRLASNGPDLWGSFGIVWGTNLLAGSREGVDYDPTNGTLSNGDIVITGGRMRSWSSDVFPTWASH